MIVEEVVDQQQLYTDDGNSLGNATTVMEYEEDEEFSKYRRDQIYAELEIEKRKTKIGFTMG